MKFVKRNIEVLDFGSCYEKIRIVAYEDENGVVYKTSGLGWFNVHNERLLGDISHLSKAADDFELELNNEK